MVFSTVVLAAIATVKTWKGTRKETRRKARKKTKNSNNSTLLLSELRQRFQQNIFSSTGLRGVS